MQFHLNDLTLLKLLKSSQRDGELPRFLDHLSRCLRCRCRLQALQRIKPAGPAHGDIGKDIDYGMALDRARQRVEPRISAYSRERNTARVLFFELMDQAPDQRTACLQGNPRFHTWGLFELLLDQSRYRCHAPGTQADLAMLALELSSCLDQSYYGLKLIEDLRARAWSYMGNAYRQDSKIREAEQAFETSFHHLQQGTGDQLEKAAVLALRGSLLRRIRDFPAALADLHKAAAIFRMIGDPHCVGRTLVKISMVQSYSGNSGGSFSSLCQAIKLINPHREPWLALCALHNLVDDLSDLGQFCQAQELLSRIQPLYGQFSASTQRFGTHLAAKIAQGLQTNSALDAERSIESRGIN